LVQVSCTVTGTLEREAGTGGRRERVKGREEGRVEEGGMVMGRERER
jgi:hypothetical protein